MNRFSNIWKKREKKKLFYHDKHIESILRDDDEIFLNVNCMFDINKHLEIISFSFLYYSSFNDEEN